MTNMESNNRSLFVLIIDCIEYIISNLPSHWFFSELRYKYYLNKLLPNSGPFKSCSGFWIWSPQNVFIGRDVYFNKNVMIATAPSEDSGVYIGNRCMFGPNVTIVATTHDYKNIIYPMRFAPSIPLKIVIEDDCWIGTNTVIAKDVRIGKNSVIGANSVVTKDIPPYSLAAGQPAKVIKKITQKLNEANE